MTEKSKEVTAAKQWVFPPKRCPRCKQLNSEATHTDSERGVQYRRCRTPLCRAIGIRFSVRGEPVTPAEVEVENPSFDCPHCQATYKRQGDLTKHIYKTHGDTTPTQSGDVSAVPEGETTDG
jgi:phage FluMu protein Com